MADAQASGACGRKIVWVQVPSPALFFSFVTNTRVAYKVGCEAQDVSFIQISDPCSFFLIVQFFSAQQKFFLLIFVEKSILL